VDDIKAQHDALCSRLAEIPRSRHRESGVWGDGWTLHDLLAHLSEWQRMFLRWYHDGLRGMTPQMPAPGYRWNETPKLNRGIWAKHRSRSARVIRAEFDAGYEEILALVEALPASSLLTAGHFAWTGRNPLVTYLGANTSSHYRFAIKVIDRWRRRTAASASARVRSRRRA
jgi:hypothetical protein